MQEDSTLSLQNSISSCTMNRKKENTSNLYNDISISDFNNDIYIFEELYKFMLDNNAKEVSEDNNGFKVIEELG